MMQILSPDTNWKDYELIDCGDFIYFEISSKFIF